MRLCRNNLHDLSDPSNLYTRPKANKSQCRPCLHGAHSKRNRERRLQDPEFRRRETDRSIQWQKDNREYRQIYDREYVAAHRERHNENCRADYRRRRDQCLAVGKRWRDANRDRMKQLVRSWAVANQDRRTESQRRRRAWKAGVETDNHTRADVLAHWGHICWICKNELPANWHEDHAVPLCLGGSDLLENCRPACAGCNLKKGRKLIAA